MTFKVYELIILSIPRLNDDKLLAFNIIQLYDPLLTILILHFKLDYYFIFFHFHSPVANLL